MIGLAVRELVVLHGERLVAADGVDLEVDEVILVVDEGGSGSAWTMRSR